MNKERIKLFNGCPDLIFFAVLALLSLVAWSIHNVSENLPAHSRFIIKVVGEKGEQIQKLTDSSNEAVVVSGKLGPVTIERNNEGKVRIASSPCRCQTCVNMGWSSYSSLICVPGGVVVEPENTQSDVDAVTR